MTLNGIEVKRCLARNLQKYSDEGKVRSVNVARHFVGQFNQEHKPFRKVKKIRNTHPRHTFIQVSDGRGGERTVAVQHDRYVYYR